jgi:hypothetical protein
MEGRVDASGRTVMKVPPILDLETWNRLQAELDRKASRKGVAPTNTALLTGIAVCAVCGGPMYRIRCGRKRADGSLADYWYYRCAGAAGRAGSNCRNMYPLEELEERVEKYMTGTMAQWPRYETVTTPGHGHEEEIYETERDIRDLELRRPRVRLQARGTARRAGAPGTPTRPGPHLLSAHPTVTGYPGSASRLSGSRRHPRPHACRRWSASGRRDQTSLSYRPSRSVIDLVGPVGAEFARNAEYARLASLSSLAMAVPRLSCSARFALLS